MRLLLVAKLFSAAVRCDCERSPVNDGGLVTQLLKLAADAVGPVLGTAEHEVRALFLTQHLVQQGQLLILHDHIRAQLHTLIGLGRSADLHADGLVDVVAHDLGDVGRPA